ncbi:MAG: hypothetical protein EOP45_18145 [Sphingobacteriaceae bacterium]|nr:MAG: hypothetical protein EOP45_18145 [Sphingobacteriaceae bacterium]
MAIKSDKLESTTELTLNDCDFKYAEYHDYQKALSDHFTNTDSSSILDVVNKANRLISKLYEELDIADHCFDAALTHYKQMVNAFEVANSQKNQLEESICELIKIDLKK